jgi:tetratricopeptide (TPR) repeat protein
MNKDQVKWLLVGLTGAFVMLALVGGVSYKILRLASEAASASGNTQKIDAPKQWQEWASKSLVKLDSNKDEYERVKELYDRVGSYREIRRRLFHEADFEYAEAELPSLFAKISEPTAAQDYSIAIHRLGELSVDTDPEDLRQTMEKWTQVHPDSHYAWLVRGNLAISYAWYWRGGGWSSTVTNEGWQHFEDAINEARMCLEKAYKLEPNDPEAPAKLIKVCMAQSSTRAEVETHFKRATALVPSHWTAYAARFEYLKPKWGGSWPDYEEALAELKPKLNDKSNPWFQAIYLDALQDMENEKAGKVSDEAKRNHNKQWLEVYEACLQRWPEDVRLHGYYLSALWEAKRWDDACDEFEWLGNRYPMDMSWNLLTFHQYRMARLIMRADALPEPKRSQEFDRIVAIDPEFGWTYFSRGQSANKQGDAESAELAFKKAIDLGQNSGNSHLSLATLYKKQGRTEEALQVAQAGLDLKPDGNVKTNLQLLWNQLNSQSKD